MPLELELLIMPAGDRLRFRESTLQFNDSIITATTSPPAAKARDDAGVQGIGRCCLLDSALAAAMLFPAQSHAYMETSNGVTATMSQIPGLYASLCSDPLSNIFVLEDPSLTAHTAPLATAFLHAFLTERVPPAAPSQSRLVSYRDAPLSILAWRLDQPAKVIVYTGAQPPTPSQMAPGSLRPHTLQKVQVAQRSKRPSPSVIALSVARPDNPRPSVASPHDASPHDASPHDDKPHDASIADDIRASLSRYVRTSLTPFQETLTVAGKNITIQAHTLEEAAVCLLYPPTRGNHTEVPLNCSLAWSKNHIDARCVFLIESLAELRHLGEQKLLARPLGVHIGPELAARRMGLHLVQQSVRVGRDVAPQIAVLVICGALFPLAALASSSSSGRDVEVRQVRWLAVVAERIGLRARIGHGGLSSSSSHGSSSTGGRLGKLGGSSIDSLGISRHDPKLLCRPTR